MVFILVLASFGYLMFISTNASTEGVEKESSLIRKLISIPMITLGGIMILISICEMFLNIELLNRSEIMRIIGYSWLLGIVLLTWGIYILNFAKSSYPIWRKVLKGIGYFLVTISYYSILETYYTAMVCMPIAIIIGIILLNLDSKNKKEESDCTGNTEKVDNLDEVNFEAKTEGRSVWKRVIVTILLPIIFVLIMIGYKEDYYFDDCRIVFFIYLIYYLSLFIYYMIVIWGKDKLNGENILMMLFLKRINLFCNISDKYQVKTLLIKTMLPTLVCSICLPIIALMLDGYDIETLKLFCVSLPFALWTFSLSYLYAKDWLQKKV